PNETHALSLHDALPISAETSLQVRWPPLPPALSSAAAGAAAAPSHHLRLLVAHHPDADHTAGLSAAGHSRLVRELAVVEENHSRDCAAAAAEEEYRRSDCPTGGSC